jgi:hypothetical protein
LELLLFALGFCGFGHGEALLFSLKQNTLTELGCCAFACAAQITIAVDRAMASGFNKGFKINPWADQASLSI